MSEFPAFLLDGYKSFMAHRYAPEEARYKVLADKGQSPTTMIIACCDSRSAPETIFDAGPGEMFVLRNVANLVPPFQPDGDRVRRQRARDQQYRDHGSWSLRRHQGGTRP
jgi:carbonic anhydrase